MKIIRLLILFMAFAVLAACTNVEMVPLPEPSAIPSMTPASATALPSLVPTLEVTVTMSPTSRIRKPTFQASLPDNFKPQPGDQGMLRGQAFVEEMGVMVRESNPPQVLLMVSGNLPTPCNKLRAQINPPDDQNRIEVGVYSVVPVNVMCAQVLSPFSASIPLEGYPKGKYSVLVNGQPAGEFELP